MPSFDHGPITRTIGRMGDRSPNGDARRAAADVVERLIKRNKNQDSDVQLKVMGATIALAATVGATITVILGPSDQFSFISAVAFGAFMGLLPGLLVGACIGHVVAVRRPRLRLSAEEVEELLTTGVLSGHLGGALTAPDLADLVSPWRESLSAAEREAFDAMVTDFAGTCSDLVEVTRIL